MEKEEAKQMFLNEVQDAIQNLPMEVDNYVTGRKMMEEALPKIEKLVDGVEKAVNHLELIGDDAHADAIAQCREYCDKIKAGDMTESLVNELFELLDVFFEFKF